MTYRKIVLPFVLAGLISLTSCEAVQQKVDTAQNVLTRLCLMKKSALGQLFLSGPQWEALRVVCNTVSEPPGVPDQP